MPRPCESLRVIDFSQSHPGALAAMVLADAGAEVIKIEPPSGDPTRSHYASLMWHRGKKSVILDLKTDEGLANARRLATTADIAIESFRPGVAHRLGVGYQTLAKDNPGLIYCSISGFGSQGPLAKIKGYEGIVNSAVGRMDTFADVVGKDAPTYHAVSLGSYAAAMNSVQAIMAALVARTQSGLGQHIETSLLQSLTNFDLMSFLRWQQYVSGEDDVPPGRYPGGGIPPYMTGRSKDGHWIQFGNLTVNTLWNFIHTLGLDYTRSDPRYQDAPVFPTPEDQSDFQRLCLASLLEKTLDEWMDLFIENDVAAEPFRTTQEGLTHPQAIHNGNVIDLVDPVVGPTKQLGPIGRLAETPLGPAAPAPSLGQHTDQVLASLSKPARPKASSNGKSPSHPLSGVTVIELASFIAAPYATALLADLGARVIKIEPLTGDLYRIMSFPRMSKTILGKESVALDLKNPDAQAVFHKLVKKADVLLHNFRPGVPERLGIDYETVRKLNPRLVYVYAAAYGSTGPHSPRVGMHPIAGAITGGPRLQLGRSLPTPPDIPLNLDEVQEMSDILRRVNEVNPDPAAALACCTATMIALYHQAATGQGQYVETSMLNGNLYANADDALSYAGKPERPLADDDMNGLHALYRLYPCGEGWVFLACPKEEEWQAFAETAGLGYLLNDARFTTSEARRRHDDALVQAIGDTLKQRPAADWQASLTEKDVACVEVYSGDNGKFMATTTWVHEAGYMPFVEHPSLGKFRRQGPPFRFSLTPAVAGTTQYLGEFTRSVLKELGYDAASIAAMEASGAALQWTPEATPVQ